MTSDNSPVSGTNKVALVIATHFGPREVRQKTVLSGRPLGYFSHSQGFDSPDAVHRLLNFTVNHHAEIDPGCPTDIIIANSDTGWSQAEECLRALETVKLKRGIVRTFTRPNIGLSFGAYSDSFLRYESEYTHFIFTEDDVLVGRPNFAARGIECLDQFPGCGFLAYVGISRNHHVTGSHAAGGIGLSSTSVLREVVRVNGCLSHFRQPSSVDRWSHIRFGEIAFTNDIEKLGYKICEIPRNEKLYDYSFDLMRNIAIERRYASWWEVLRWGLSRLIARLKIF